MTEKPAEVSGIEGMPLGRSLDGLLCVEFCLLFVFAGFLDEKNTFLISCTRTSSISWRYGQNWLSYGRDSTGFELTSILVNPYYKIYCDMQTIICTSNVDDCTLGITTLPIQFDPSGWPLLETKLEILSSDAGSHKGVVKRKKMKTQRAY